jgi:hypothetical protein
LDARHFESLTRSFRPAGARRGLLGLLASLPFLGGVAGALGPNVAEAKGRRKKKRKHKPKPAPCQPDPPSQTCAGKCGSVTNNCLTTIECGACPCTPISSCPASSCGAIDTGCGGTLSCGACPTCQTCVNGRCIADASQEHTCCEGTNGKKWCQAGACIAITNGDQATLARCKGRCDCSHPGTSCPGDDGIQVIICGQFVPCPHCDDCTNASNDCVDVTRATSGPLGAGYYCVASNAEVAACPAGTCPDPNNQVCAEGDCLEICFGNPG